MRFIYRSSSVPTLSCVALILAFSVGELCAQNQKVSVPVPPGENAKQSALNLLGVRWEKNSSNRESSAKELESFPNDPDVLLAYTINRMQHRRYKDALESAQKLSKVAPDELNGAVLHIWLETLSDNFEEALIAMLSLGRQMNGRQDLDNASKEWTLRRIGRLVGYMQGPAKFDTDPDLLTAAIISVTQGLTPNQLEVFNNNREKVLKKYEQLTDSNVQIVAAARQKAAADNANQTRTLAAQNQEFDELASQLEPKIEVLRNEGLQKLDQIRAEASPLQQDLSSLSNQIGYVNYNLNSLYLRLAYCRHNHRYARGRRGGVVYVDPIYSNSVLISYAIRDQLYELGRLRNLYDSVANQLAVLEERGYQIQNEYDLAIGNMNSDLEALEDEKQRNIRQLDNLARRPQKVAQGKIGSLRNRAEALKTYDPISLEVYRQILIQKLK